MIQFSVLVMGERLVVAADREEEGPVEGGVVAMIDEPRARPRPMG